MTLQHVFSWEETRHVAAPMVNNSERAFRMMLRMHGNVQLAFTPMWHAEHFRMAAAGKEGAIQCVREAISDTAPPLTADAHLDPCWPPDRPLIAQLCATRVDDFVLAATTLAAHVDGIDLNRKYLHA